MDILHLSTSSYCIQEQYLWLYESEKLSTTQAELPRTTRSHKLTDCVSKKQTP